jgi:hypothetical protein
MAAFASVTYFERRRLPVCKPAVRIRGTFPDALPEVLDRLAPFRRD